MNHESAVLFCQRAKQKNGEGDKHYTFIVAQNTAVSSTSSLTLTKMAIDYCHDLTNVAISGKLFHSYINRETRPSSSYS